MNPNTKSSTGLARPAWTVAFAWILLLFVGGCAGPQNVLVNLGPYEPQHAQGATPAAPRGTVRIEPVKDARADAVGSLIGQRTTIGNISMGEVEMSPLPTDAMAQLLRTEFTQMGYGIVNSGQQFTVAAQLRKFQVVTPATALYWDINGSIELDVTVAAQNGKKHDASYTAACTDRTYIYPSEEIIRNVVAGCVRDIGAKLRGDATLARFIGAR
jgi:uncharacterized lipoprotein YajG